VTLTTFTKASKTARAASAVPGLSCVLNAQTGIYAVKDARLFADIGGALDEPGLVVIFGGKS
jgi:hypothetical protein